jgi:hypothetical protein
MAQGWGRAGFGTDYWGATSVSVTLGTLVATSAIGSVTIYENEIVNAPSLAITSSLGSVTTSAEATATVTGLSVTTDLGLVLVWGDIDESQTPSYSAIDESQTPDWQEEAA